MNKRKDQLHLFMRFTDPTSEIKRQIRYVLAESRCSREEIVDKMNALAASVGSLKKVTKATLDGWCKESDPDRIPSIFWMVIFCKIMETSAPLEPMVESVDCGGLAHEEMGLLRWAKCEMEKRQAIKRAKIAYESINDGNGRL